MVIFQPVKGRGPSNAVTHVLTDMSKPLAYHLYTAINDHKKGVWKGERKWTQKNGLLLKVNPLLLHRALKVGAGGRVLVSNSKRQHM